MMNGDSSGCLLLSIPEDVFVVISRSLSPSDICNLSLCCKSLCDLVDSEKIWLVRCELLNVLPLPEIVQWRTGVGSYKAICRFLVEVLKPLAGIWVAQNPELGNVVFLMPGFLSVVGCRIIPQTVGPLGIEEGRVMWSPVFEIICGFDGSISFFLHGRDKEGSCIYPGLVTGIERNCNELLLEVEACSETKREQVPFSTLKFIDRRKLLSIVTSHVGLHVVEPFSGKLFPCSNDDDEAVLLERRTMLLKMHKFGASWKNMNLEEDRLCYNPTQVDLNEIWENVRLDFEFDNLEFIHTDHQNFLSSGDTFGIGLKASYNEMSSHKGWPSMRSYRYALYKLPIKNPPEDELYAGVWGGTFGWPPGEYTDDKPEKPLYLLMLSYKDDSDGRVLIATKILEGTRYVHHPNGSAMFNVYIDIPSLEPFPFDKDGKNIEESYAGEGIADGYGFRGPCLKPGSLFVISNDHLAFVWQETKDVVTLQRLNLGVILKKGLGLCMSPLDPTKNFAYMVRSYINEFTNSSNYSCSSE